MEKPVANHFVRVPSEERDAIVDLLYRFGAGQDLRDRALLESAFAEDAALDFVQPTLRLTVRSCRSYAGL